MQLFSATISSLTRDSNTAFSMDLKAIIVNSFRSVSLPVDVGSVGFGKRESNDEKFILQHLFLPKMGCMNGKEILTEEDKDYIAQNTAISREEIDQHHENFLQKHPDGKISRLVVTKSGVIFLT